MLTSPVYETPDYEVDHLINDVLSPYAIDLERLVPCDSKATEPVRGGFGTVERMFLLPTPDNAANGKQLVAVKKFIVETDTHHERLKRRAAREMMVWSRLRHPNILEFTGFHLDVPAKAAWLVCPWEAAGALPGYIKDRSPSPSERIRLVGDACEGLKYLHTQNPPISHGDIKGANVLIRIDGHRARAILCDFGLSRIEEDESHTSLDTAQAWAGSVRWCSPEIFSTEEILRTPQSDMWAWGWLAWEVMTERIPYFKIKFDLAVIGSIVQLQLPQEGQEPLLAKIPRSLLALMRACWAKTPEERLRVQECLTQVKALMDGVRTPLPPVMPEVDIPITAARPTVDRQKRVMKRPTGISRSIPRRNTGAPDTMARYASLQMQLETTLQETPVEDLTTSNGDTLPFEEQTPLLANGNGSSVKPPPTQNGKHAVPGEFGADDEDAPKGVAPVDAAASSPNQVVVWQPYSFLPISFVRWVFKRIQKFVWWRS